jgi:hypothetical protein
MADDFFDVIDLQPSAQNRDRDFYSIAILSSILLPLSACRPTVLHFATQTSISKTGSYSTTMSNPTGAEAGYQSIPTIVPDEENDSLRPPPPFARQLNKGALVSEFFGTATLVQIGCGANCIQLYLVEKSVAGQWQVTAIWMLAAILGIYISAPQSGGHLNPAVTLAFALVRPRDFPYKSVLPYWIAQLFGGMAAGLINMMLFTTAIMSYEQNSKNDHGLKSAAAFGDYWRYVERLCSAKSHRRP